MTTPKKPVKGKRPQPRELLRAYKRTPSIRVLAADLGVSHETIRRWCAEAGVKLRAWKRAKAGK